MSPGDLMKCQVGPGEWLSPGEPETFSLRPATTTYFGFPDCNWFSFRTILHILPEWYFYNTSSVVLPKTPFRSMLCQGIQGALWLVSTWLSSLPSSPPARATWGVCASSPVAVSPPHPANSPHPHGLSYDHFSKGKELKPHLWFSYRIQ